MPRCSFKNCKNHTSRTLKKDGVSYFRFPRDPVRCAEWISIIARQRREEFFKPNQASVVCSKHFLENDEYETPKGIKRLRKTAVPQLEANDHEVKVEYSFDKNTTEQYCLKSEIKIEPVDPEDLKSPTSSLSIDPIPDTPKEIVMKKKLLAWKKLIKLKNNKLANFRKKIARLKKKCKNLKDIVSKLNKRQTEDNSILHDLSKHIEVKDTVNAIYLKNIKGRKRPFSQYPPGARKFAITLHLYSPAAYKYMRKMFDTCLPHPNTLCNWYRSTKAEPGFTGKAFDRLKGETGEAKTEKEEEEKTGEAKKEEEEKEKTGEAKKEKEEKEKTGEAKKEEEEKEKTGEAKKEKEEKEKTGEAKKEKEEKEKTGEAKKEEEEKEKTGEAKKEEEEKEKTGEAKKEKEDC